MTYEISYDFCENAVQKLMIECRWDAKMRALNRTRKMLDRSWYYCGHKDPHTNQLVSFLRISLDGYFALVQDVLVHPAHRKQGLGKELMKHAENYCSKNSNIFCLWLVNQAGFDFYEKLGYTNSNLQAFTKSIDHSDYDAEQKNIEDSFLRASCVSPDIFGSASLVKTDQTLYAGNCSIYSISPKNGDRIVIVPQNPRIYRPLSRGEMWSYFRYGMRVYGLLDEDIFVIAGRLVETLFTLPCSTELNADMVPCDKGVKIFCETSLSKYVFIK